MFCKFGVIILIFHCLLGRFNCHEVDGNFNQLIHETDWPCDTGCVGAAGRAAESNSGHEFCRCYMDKHIDDTDLLLLRKLAQATGAQLVISENLPESTHNTRKERDINKSNLAFKRIRKAQDNHKFTTKKPLYTFTQSKKTNRFAVNTPKPMKFKAVPKASSSTTKQNQRLKELEDKLEKLRSKFKSTPHLHARNGFDAEEQHKSLMEELKEKQKELRLKFKNRMTSSEKNDNRRVGSIHVAAVNSPSSEKNKLIKSSLTKPEQSKKDNRGLVVSPVQNDPIVGKSIGGNGNVNHVEKDDGIKAQPSLSSSSTTSTTTTTTPTPVEPSRPSLEHSSSTATGSKLKQKLDETKSKLQNLLATPVASPPQDDESKVKSKDSSVSLVIQQIKEKQKEKAQKMRKKVLPQKNIKTENGQLWVERVDSGGGDVEGEKKDN